MDEREISPHLTEAYQAADPEMEPSPSLRDRTLRELRDLGIVAPVRRRNRWLRADWIRTAAIAAGAAAISFLGGFHLSDARQTAALDGTADPNTTTRVEAALQELQRTGSEHARALDRLVANLDAVDVETLVRAQEVVLAAERARWSPSRILLSGRAFSPLERDSRTDGNQLPLVWF